jgi:uncharacterized protein YwlG (UPF0340 family)
MNKLKSIIISVAVIVAFQSCNSSNRSKEIEKYQYSESKVELNEMLNKKVGSWIKEGSECYGLVMMVDKDGNVQAIKELKALVLIIQNDKIKMKALEEVSLAPKAGCSKMGLSKGETWWEEEGDLFQTREEAVAFGESVRIERKPPTGGKFTVD